MALLRQKRKQQNRGVLNKKLSPPTEELSVTLQRYLGDVLCAYFLMGHSVSRIIEGGLSEQAWMDHVFSVRPNTNKNEETTWSTTTGNGSQTDEQNHHHDDAVAQLYRRWIFLHSTLLRTAPFTMEQQIQLGIQLPFSSQEETTRHVDDDDYGMENNNVGDLCLIFPHVPFVGIPKSPIFQRLLRERPLSSILMNDRDNETAPLPPPLRMKLNDFGHLGPAFRGRDLIRSQTIFASSPACTVVAFESWMAAAGGVEHDNMNGRITNPFFEAWRQGRDDGILWILQLHREAYKATPLTVEPHIITIKK
eukprot:CAMPEP_0195299086 /NCGR_PEP_ID=MMETSP0707-20130614/24832_1 /TAXON_ID=33640 /ORGANISM="Asterionellopsis glacialis, Strain CCMP134" /LENGTH=306 /DNA_ID=CAMNT_0040361371 /DNA_START=27 /DNA_END=947 /DNA_ORIENTATION=-